MTDVPPSDTSRPSEVPDEILRLRGSIDNVDAALMHLLAERFKFTRRVGELKAEAGLPAADLGREAAQIARLGAIAEGSGLDPAFAEQFREFIVSEVKRQHRTIAAARSGRATTSGVDEPDLYA
ncbi:chorismate mutase [Paraoerskovia sediminicola]|uniref:Chorismate mutase n=1 Tax=Paraoerskovia sediminicola TaxID=1138587 RepID=A0ABM8FYN6_9CELL|nr:chorismate mutase [Paraoerskovia sediminicola]BDZ40723.1 chorismate mutase [Paraoerskovia sediminicola]